jgi:hypothetical protein
LTTYFLLIPLIDNTAVAEQDLRGPSQVI